MASQHAPAESGRRPLTDVLEPAPTCHLCTWAFRVKDGKFGLKFLHTNCQAHRQLAGGRGSIPARFPEWLLPAA